MKASLKASDQGSEFLLSLVPPAERATEPVFTLRDVTLMLAALGSVLYIVRFLVAN